MSGSETATTPRRPPSTPSPLPYHHQSWWERAGERLALRLPEFPRPVTVHDESTGSQLTDHTPAIALLRWTTVAISVALAAPPVLNGDAAVGYWTAAVVIHHLIRIGQPVPQSDSSRALFAAFFEIALVAVGVVATGLWGSPLIVTMIATATTVGFHRGFGSSLRLVATCSVTLLASGVAWGRLDSVETQLGLNWVAALLLVSIVSAYARRISSEVVKDHSLTLDRVDRLADANQLLTSLHRVAQTMSTSLDQAEVVDKTFARLKGLIDAPVVALLLFDETDARWQVLRSDGARLPVRLGPTDLPEPLYQALTVHGIHMVSDLSGRDGPGVAGESGSGMYAPMTARGELVGIVALEREDTHAFSDRDIELLNGLMPSVALGLDNARMFRRIRTVAADEERTRIARDLHDRMGQSLAYLAFELDRLSRTDDVPTEIHDSISGLKDDVRHVIREVRDTLFDLRTDVSEERDMTTTLREYLDQVEARSSLSYELDCDGDDRLPLNQEREFWRIAQEAVRNVERHAEASHVSVTYRCDGRRATVEITDDGRGFEAGAGRVDSYGMLGMRERAASIGATLEIDSAPGEGTSVLCRLNPTTPTREIT